MRTSQLLVMVGMCLAMCHAAAGTEGRAEPGPTVALDHAKLTQWVLEDFADGLPFDRDGTPTDFDKAKQFWQLLADWPINVAGQVTDLRTAIDTISKETGLPVYFGKDAWTKLEAAGAEMKMVTIQDSVQKAVRIIAGLAGVDKVAVTPLGLVVLGPDEDPDDDTLLTAPPTNTFRWRQNCRARFGNAFPNGYDNENATPEEQALAAKTILETRCDLVVAEETELPEFLSWFAHASEVNIAAHLDPEPATVQPFVMRFSTFGEVLDAALAGTGLVRTDMQGPGLLIVPEGLTKEELEELRRQDVESTRSNTESFRQEESSDD